MIKCFSMDLWVLDDASVHFPSVIVLVDLTLTMVDIRALQTHHWQRQIYQAGQCKETLNPGVGFCSHHRRDKPVSAVGFLVLMRLSKTSIFLTFEQFMNMSMFSVSVGPVAMSYFILLFICLLPNPQAVATTPLPWMMTPLISTSSPSSPSQGRPPCVASPSSPKNPSSIHNDLRTKYFYISIPFLTLRTKV